MHINLLEIPDEGKTFSYDQHSSELKAILQDIVGGSAYKTEFTIRPMQTGTYELTGWIQTELPEECSRCGLDFKMDVNEKFRELLMPEQEMPRNSKFTKANHVSDMNEGGPSVVEYQGHHFNAGEYLHEVVAIAEPFIPAPPCNAQGDCTVCKKAVKDVKFGYEDPDFEKPVSPFSVLKDIKLS